jgi:hypothetical protein
LCVGSTVPSGLRTAEGGPSFSILGPRSAIHFSPPYAPAVAFGDCCTDLQDCLNGSFNRVIFEETNGSLYMSVGWIQSEDGVRWFDHAVFFCPFCGARLQTPEEVKDRAHST